MYPDAFVARAPERPAVNDASRSVGLVVFAALLALAAGAGFVTANTTQSWFPTKWDPRVAPIADEVSKLRGLTFLHPVSIEYLTPAAFEKTLGADGNVSVAARAEVRREEAVFRSLGFIGGKVDLLKESDTSTTSGTLAYYSPRRQEIFVRGTTLDVEHRVTVAHELTHVLQDQHFDLTKLEQRAIDSDSGDAGALKALVEGDAVRIEDDYLAQLSAADRKEYARENAAEGARVGKETSSVPAIITLFQGAPYEFGPASVRVILGSGGNQAVNDALTGPTPSTEVYTATGDIDAPVAVDAPPIPGDGVKVGDEESFGPFEMYLTLSSRIDPQRALEAADVISGGKAITYSRGGTTCYRVAVQPSSAHSRPFLLGAVQSWATGRGGTTLDVSGDLVGFIACDPGTAAPVPSSTRFDAAVKLLEVRTGLTVGAAKDEVSGDLARCFAREVVRHPGAVDLIVAIGDNKPTAAQNALLRPILAASGAGCRADSSSGLP